MLVGEIKAKFIMVRLVLESSAFNFTFKGQFKIYPPSSAS